MIEVEFLGTGTSTGVPQLGCECEVCKSADPRDKRLRCSAIVRTQGVSLLIDCGPDFRQQMLRASDLHLDALLITHSHYDHVKARIPYCFREHLYPGVPTFDMHPLAGEPFEVKGVRVEPLPVMHYKLPIFGYRIGNLAYITDAKTIPPSTMARLQGIDTLIINALRFEPHLSHMNLEETLAVVAQANPRRALLIHESDGIGLHEATSRLLPQGVELAYDKEIIRVP